jgi:hypothetical protein
MEPINWLLFAIFIAIAIWKVGKSYWVSRREGRSDAKQPRR